MRSHVVVVLAPDPSFSNFVYDEVFKSGFEAGTWKAFSLKLTKGKKVGGWKVISRIYQRDAMLA